jgi:hypothetical protein
MVAPRFTQRFKLVELAVVAVLIVALIHLLLPALNAHREAQRRASCINKVRQIGLGFGNYSTTFNNAFPASAHLIRVSATTSRVGGFSFLFRLLSFMEYAAGVSTHGLRTFLTYDCSSSGAEANGYMEDGDPQFPLRDTVPGATQDYPAYGPSSAHPRVMIVGMGDGSTMALSKRVDAAAFFFLITKSNGDPFCVPRL